MSAIASFKEALRSPRLLQELREGLVGEGAPIDGPFGRVNLVYADYVASGRALRQVERFVAEEVLPYYANSHTEASFCGAYSTSLREEARAEIARIVGADDSCSVVFTGSGATAGLNRIVGLLGVAELMQSGSPVLVLVGPYEHHSNLLPWRESGATVREVKEAPAGGPDLQDLERYLKEAGRYKLVVGAFSAASNVTGILTDVDAVTRLLKSYGAYAIWDYAGGGPYLPMDMGRVPEEQKDAIVFSSHKFPGGPGGSGVMVVRDTIVKRRTPTLPGGGTVSFVSPQGHRYSESVSAREEAGTPNVVGDVRAALALLVKEAIGTEFIAQRDRELRERALSVWQDNPSIELLGNPDASEALPIFSFRVRGARGLLVHHQLFTRLLSDVHGIQARGGCACAGSYAHRLLNITESESKDILAKILEGEELKKPGWIRLNLSYLLSDETADFIIHSVDELARHAADYVTQYDVDEATARFRPRVVEAGLAACR